MKGSPGDFLLRARPRARGFLLGLPPHPPRGGGCAWRRMAAGPRHCVCRVPSPCSDATGREVTELPQSHRLVTERGWGAVPCARGSLCAAERTWAAYPPSFPPLGGAKVSPSAPAPSWAEDVTLGRTGVGAGEGHGRGHRVSGGCGWGGRGEGCTQCRARARGCPFLPTRSACPCRADGEAEPHHVPVCPVG